MKAWMGAGFAALVSLSAAAQSLDSRAPQPLAAGEIHATVDSKVGAQYWSFQHRKGEAALVVKLRSDGRAGRPIEIVLRDSAGGIVGSRVLSPESSSAKLDWRSVFAREGTAIVEIRPDMSGLVRVAEDYSISVSGRAVEFTSSVSRAAPERIVGTYAVMVCAPDLDCRDLAIRFAPDGTVATTDGHKGRWRVIDGDRANYSVSVGRDHWNLKLVPGRGLFAAGDLDAPVFQAVRPD